MNINIKSIYNLFQDSKKCSSCIISIKDDKLSISRFSYAGDDISLDKYNENSLEEISSINQKKELIQKSLTYWAQIGYNNKKDKFYLLLPYEYISCQTMVFPKMPNRELREAISLKLTLSEKEIHFFQVLREFEEDNKQKIEIIIIIVDEDKLNDLINIVENAGFELNAVMPETTALSSLFNLEEMKGVYEGCMFVEIHQDDTHVTAFNNKSYSFSRKLNLGKKSFRNDLVGTTVSDAGQINIDETLAEKILEEVGIVFDDKDGDYYGIKYSHIKVLQRQVLEKYLSEFYRSFDYFGKLTDKKEIKKIYLIGPSNRLKNFKEFLEKEFKVEVINLESKLKVLNNPGIIDLSILLAVFLDKGKMFNLLPDNLKYRPVILKLTQMVKVVSVFIVALMIFLISFGETKILMIKKNIKKAESVLEVLNPSLIAANKLEEKNKEYQEKKLFFKELLGNDILSDEFFIEISNLIPNDVLLNKLLVNQAVPGAEGETSTVNLSIEGLVFSGKKSIADNLAELILNIEKSPLFFGVKLQYAKINNSYNIDAQEFRIITNCNTISESS